LEVGVAPRFEGWPSPGSLRTSLKGHELLERFKLEVVEKVVCYTSDGITYVTHLMASPFLLLVPEVAVLPSTIAG
jgi:hypothetical protein